MKTCINCGVELDDSAKFCMECGTKQPEPKKHCSNCGAELANGAKFCMECGTPIAVTEPAKNSVEEAKPTTPENPKMKISVILHEPDADGTYAFESDQHHVIVNVVWVDGTNECFIYAPDDNRDKDVVAFVKSLDSKRLDGVEVVEVTDVAVEGDKLPKEFNASLLDHKGRWNLKQRQLPRYASELLSIIMDAKNIDWPEPLCNWQVETSFTRGSEGVCGRWNVVDGEIVAESQQCFSSENEAIAAGFTLTCKEAAEMLDVSESTVDQLVEQGKLTAINIGNSVRYSQWEVMNLYANLNAKSLVEDAFKEGLSSIFSDKEGSIEEDEDLEDEEEDLEEEEEDLDEEQFNRKLTYKRDDSGTYGYVDSEGNWVIKPQFNDAWDFADGIAMVEVGGKYGYIKPDGTWLLEPQFDIAWGFADGIAAVKVGGKWGYIKRDGTWLLEPQFDDACSFEGGISIAKVGGKWGYIKPDGTWLLEPQFDDAWGFNDGIAVVQVDDKLGFIKRDGTWLLEPQFDNATNFHKGTASVEIDDKWGAINRQGKWVVKPIYDDPDDLDDIDFNELEEEEDLNEEQPNRKTQFESVCEFDEKDMARARFDEKVGFINRQYEWVIEPKFDEVEDFDKEDMAPATLDIFDGTYGFINRRGEWVIKPEFDWAGPFDDKDIAKVRFNGKWGAINRQGKWVVKPIYDDPDDLDELEEEEDLNEEMDVDKLRNTVVEYADFENARRAFELVVDDDYQAFKEKEQQLRQQAAKWAVSDELDWKQFGEYGNDVERYGVPDDKYGGELEYAIVNGDTLLIRGETESMFNIPSFWAKVNRDANYWDLNEEIKAFNIKRLAFCGDIRSIGKRCFDTFVKLEVVVMPDEVKSICEEAFNNSMSLKYITLPTDLRYIGENAFLNAKFKSILLPKSCNQIGKGAFSGTPLTTAFIPKGEFAEMDDVFGGCKKLKRDESGNIIVTEL